MLYVFTLSSRQVHEMQLGAFARTQLGDNVRHVMPGHFFFFKAGLPSTTGCTDANDSCSTEPCLSAIPLGAAAAAGTGAGAVLAAALPREGALRLLLDGCCRSPTVAALPPPEAPFECSAAKLSFSLSIILQRNIE